ncbi:hypothetical protein PYW08_006673 [Mythimna loreyi]|uniref:Uncharacterized protein n=1 Tax=Mythimna loreyi TaxID=667449 RepID=A0ACC2R7Q1_9NEOP|nr:hypothetical protein PYW08_006673 [Mythimna loreyi]
MGTTRMLCSIALISSAAALLTSPPRIVKQPNVEEILFQVAQPGEKDVPFALVCEAEGEPAPKYRWIKNGKPLEYASYVIRISQLSGSGTLVISQPRDEDLGQYQCFAYNEWGTAASNSVFVRRAELNSFKESLNFVKAKEGEPFNLTCEPPDGYPKLKVYWMLQSNQGQLTTIKNSRITLDPEGNLWFSNVTRNDANINFAYVCIANYVFRNEYEIGQSIYLRLTKTGNESALNRHEPVRQYTSRTVEKALKGKRLELYCIYGGTPLPEIVWKKNGQSILWSKRITQYNFGKTMVFEHLMDEDQGTYSCEVSNGVGPDQSYSIQLIIEAAPFFTVEPEIQNLAEGETAEIKCEAAGTPVPKITWIHNGKPIEQAEPNPRRQVTANTIVITNLVKKDTGNYGCNATSSIGYVYKDVYINVHDKNTIQTTYTIEIISSVLGALLILLIIIIAIRKRCWIKDNQIPHQLPTHDLFSNRFYANLLFRRECDAEIEEIENHTYEEIREHPHEETGRPRQDIHIYEEANLKEDV